MVELFVLPLADSSMWECLQTFATSGTTKIQTLACLNFPEKLTEEITHSLQEVYSFYIPDSDWLKILPKPLHDITIQQEVLQLSQYMHLMILTCGMLQVNFFACQVLVTDQFNIQLESKQSRWKCITLESI